MDIILDIWNRSVEQLFGRADGPLFFRLYVMPVVASIVGIRLGIKDAKKNEPTLLSRLFADSTERRLVLRPGWKEIRRIIVVALILDTIYQLISFHTLYIFQAIIVAIVCAFLPYTIGRGVSQRFACWFLRNN